MREEILDYLWRTGLVRQSVDRLTPELDRCERYLRSWGVTTVPPRWASDHSHRTALAHNLMNLLICQSSLVRNKEQEHHLRNLIGVRPYKI